MKKSMLCAGLVAVLNVTAHADDAANLVEANKATQILQTASSDAIPRPAVSENKNMQLATNAPAPTPTPGTPTSTTGSTPTPALNISAEPTSPTTPTTATQTPTGAQTPVAKDTQPNPTNIKAPQPLNCKYHIPVATTQIESTVIKKWAEKAAEQSFDFDHHTLDKQITELKSCYTEQGWQGFNDALQKSGNINAIKSQQLIVSAVVDGESSITQVKDNQWKVTVPLQVVYQNDKEKLTQPLAVSLLVGRKPSGDLGIMQMIAIPSQATSTPANTEAGAQTKPAAQ